MEVIKEICNKIAVMEHGCVLEVGQLIDVYTKPQSQITQDFLAKDMHFERLSLPHEGETAKMLHLKYIGGSTGSPLISALSQHFKVTANITFGNIEKLQDILVGNLVIDLHGSEEEVQKALDYIRQHIEVEVIDDERIITRTSA